MINYPDPFLLPSREKEIKRVVSEISAREVTIAYFGLHKMGKEIFVKKIHEELESKGAHVINVLVSEDISSTLYAICVELKRYGISLDDEIKEEAPDPIYGYIKMIQEALYAREDKEKERLVLIFRDFDRFTSTISILRNLLDFFDNPKKYGISIILIMTKTLEMIINRETARPTEVPGRFYNENRRQIKPYMKKEVLEWCNDIGMEEGDGEKVWQLSVGHPYLMGKAARLFCEKHHKGWINRLEDETRDYYGKLGTFLEKIGIDSGCNPSVHNLLDAVIRFGKFKERISRTAELFLSDYGLFDDAQKKIICADLFWEVMNQDGRIKEDEAIEKKTRRSGGSSSYAGQQIRAKSSEYDAIRVSENGKEIRLGGDCCKVTSKGVWKFLDELCKAEKNKPGDGWIVTSQQESSGLLRGAVGLISLKDWILFENKHGTKEICGARFKKKKDETPPDRK